MDDRGRYAIHHRVAQVQREAQELRESDPDGTPVQEWPRTPRGRRPLRDVDRRFEASDAFVARWVKAAIIVVPTILSIVAGTVLTVNWLDQRIKGHIRAAMIPIEMKIDQANAKLERLLDDAEDR